MKTPRRFCAALLLTFAFALTVLGGDMETPKEPAPPAPTSTSSATTSTTESGESTTVVVTAAEAALRVAEGVLSIF